MDDKYFSTVEEATDEALKYALSRLILTPKWLYRLESTDPTNGLWYDNNGNFCFEKGVGSLGESCKTRDLPMGYDERYRQDGRMWRSSCTRREDLTRWLSKEDARKLSEKGFVFAKYLATEYVEYEFETVFIKETALERIEIGIDEFFDSSDQK